jgi:hypothetical protein
MTTHWQGIIMDNHSPKCKHQSVKVSPNCDPSKRNALATPSARAQKAPDRKRQKPAPVASVSTSPVLPEPQQDQEQPKRQRFTKDHARRLLVSTDSEFFNKSKFVTSGKWKDHWQVHYRSARRGSQIVKPEQWIYFRLYKLTTATDGDGFSLVPITGDEYKTIDALIPAHTRGVWLSVIGQASANSAYRGVPLIGYRVTYRQIVEALTQHDLSRNPVPQDWREFINQQLKALTRIYYQRKGETGKAERTVFMHQPSPLPLIGVEWRSDDREAVYIRASSELFWVLNGLGRTRVLPVSVCLPRSPWAYCVCAKVLAHVCSARIRGKSDIPKAFSDPNACKVVREQYKRSAIDNNNKTRDLNRLIDAVSRMLESLVRIGALKHFKEQNGVFSWERNDKGSSLTEQGLYAHYLAMAGQKIISGEMGFCCED